MLLRPNRPVKRLSISVIALLGSLSVIAGCQTPPTAPVAPPVNTGLATAGTSPGNDPSKSQADDHEPFDSDRAMSILKKQCDLGVRPLGSDAHEKLTRPGVRMVVPGHSEVRVGCGKSPAALGRIWTHSLGANL